MQSTLPLHATSDLGATIVAPRTFAGAAAWAAASQRFEPLRTLGAGGAGEVTLARDHDIDRPVALKRLHAGAPSEHFVHEIRTVGQLEHPNIAPVHDVGIDDEGRHYFVMRYIEGETLQDLIAKLAAGDAATHARWPFTERVSLFFGILHAIGYAHAKGIVHRDIKPANIMIGPFGEVVVMDWGVAKREGVVEAPGSLVGTPMYMSPEQARGEVDAIDARSDVYALGALFYELLALQHYLPARGSLAELLAAILDEEHALAALVSNAHQPPVPAELSWFVEKALAKDPAQRYQSVAEMTRALQVAMTGAFPVQCPITLMKRIGNTGLRFTDRHPIVSMASAVAAMALITFGLVGLVQHLV